MPGTRGPGGKGTTNFDSYQTASPPPAPVLTTAVKVIIATDKKTGPPKPAFLGGNPAVVGGCADTYYE